MFRSLMTIIREFYMYLTKVKLRRYINLLVCELRNLKIHCATIKKR